MRLFLSETQSVQTASSGNGSSCDDAAADNSPSADTGLAAAGTPAAYSLFYLPANVWAVIAPRLSARAVEALRLTCRAATQLVDSQLLRRLRLTPTVPWLLRLQRADVTCLLTLRFPALEELSLRPASAKDFVRRIDLAACLAALGPCPSLTALQLSGWPVPYQAQLYGTLPAWAPSLTALSLDGVSFAGAGGGGGGRLGDGEGAAVVGALAAGLPSLRRLSLRLGAVAGGEHRPPPACPRLGALTQLTELHLTGVVPNAATAASLESLTRLTHLGLDLLHDGYDKGMQLLDLRRHTRLTTLALRARPVWQHPQLQSSAWSQHLPHRHHHIDQRSAAASPLPCPAPLRRTLQRLPPSLEALAVDLPPWRPRRDAGWPLPPPTPPNTALAPAAAAATASDRVAPPLALRFLACPPGLLPCLGELGLGLSRLACLRLRAVDPGEGLGGGEVAAAAAGLRVGSTADTAWCDGGAAAPYCWPFCCGRCCRVPSSPPSSTDQQQHQQQQQQQDVQRLVMQPAEWCAAPALLASSQPRGGFSGADVVTALGCLPAHLLLGRRGSRTSGPEAASFAASADAAQGPGGGAKQGGCLEAEARDALSHLEINARIGRAAERELMQTLGNLAAAPRPAPGPYPAGDAPSFSSSSSAAAAAGTAAAAAAAAFDAEACLSLDLQLSLERDLPPAALVASLAGSAVGRFVRHLALLDLDLSHPVSRYDIAQQHALYGSRDGPAADSGGAGGEGVQRDVHGGDRDATGAGGSIDPGDDDDDANERCSRASSGMGTDAKAEAGATTCAAVGPGSFLSPCPSPTAAALLTAVLSLRQLRTLTLAPARNLLGALRVLARHPVLRVLRLLGVEEDGARAADRPLLPRLLSLVLALGGDGNGDDQRVGGSGGFCGAGAGARGRRVLVVLPQLLVWEADEVNREAEAVTGGTCGCELLGGV